MGGGGGDGIQDHLEHEGDKGRGVGLAAVLADDRPVDIYLVGGNSDEAIRTWAIRHNIPVEKVRSRQITLNHDGGLWLRYGQGQMPVILQQGENGWQLAAF